MNAQQVLDFLKRLTANNNREWFNAHKEEWLACKADLEVFTAQWIEAMQEIDPATADLKVKDCMYRIYRDTRFSHNKAPYKDWIGLIIAPHGGRKSPYGCYYLHFQPGQCLFAGGVWCPEPDMIKALRRDIFDNYEELESIFSREDVAPYFQGFDHDGELKKLPAPYSQTAKDFPHPKWISRTSFTFEYRLTDADMQAPDFFERLLTLCRAAKPLNDFLNYTVTACI